MGYPASYVLQARFADGREQTIHIRDERAVVGAFDCDVLVEEPGVSAQHAELLFREGIVGVRDLGSTNGTWVCDRRVDRAILRPGRWFRVGHTTFELLDIQMPLDEVAGGGGGTSRPVLDVAVVPRAQPPAPIVPVDDDPTTVFIAESDAATGAWLASSLRDLHPRIVTSGSEAVRRTSHLDNAVVIIGRHLPDMTPADLVSMLGGHVAILAPQDVAPASDRVFYRLRPGLSGVDLVGIVQSALRPRGGDVVPISTARAWSSKLVFDICATVGSRPDPALAAAAVEDGIARLLAVSRATCAFYDAESGLVWTESEHNPVETVATSGIVGFVARTGRAVHAPTAGGDPRYDGNVDDPAGRGNEAILAVPAIGADREVHAVLVAIREPTQGYFDQQACEVLAELGREVGPVLQRLGALVEAQQVLEEQQQGPKALELFRPEAVAAYRNRRDEEGDVIRVSPGWSRTMYWALLVMLIVGALGLALGEISQYSEGPCVVRQEGRAEVVAAGAGALASIEVEAGTRVREGQVLARLTDGSERSAYDATRNDFHAQLRSRLLDPTDEAAAAQAQAMRRQLDAAEAALEERVLRAPHDGIVTDIGVDEGQHLKIGDAVMAVVDDRIDALEVIAFLPGGDRPQIEPGMPMRIELQGFDYAYQDVTVETISEGVVGPGEAKRLLGPQLADTLPLGGGVVMVRARLPGTTFESDGVVYPYHDGMGGGAEVRLRDETVLEMLIPALREL